MILKAARLVEAAAEAALAELPAVRELSVKVLQVGVDAMLVREPHLAEAAVQVVLAHRVLVPLREPLQVTEG